MQPLALAPMVLATVYFTLSCAEDDALSPTPRTTRPPILWKADDAAAWSPDGKKIAYHRSVTSSDGPPGLYFINRDGTSNRLLVTGNLYWPQDIRFSPDGMHISMTVGREVYILRVSDLYIHQVTHTGGNAEWADWSPDSGFLVYGSPLARTPPEESNLFVIDLASGKEHPITSPTGPLFGGYPQWSPRGDLIAFSGPGCDGGLQDIFTIKPDGTELRCLTAFQDPAMIADWPRWIYNGEGLIYHLTDWVPERRVRSMCIDVDAGSEAELSSVIGFFDAVSPDSRHVVTVAAQEDSIGTLFIREFDDEDGSTLRQLTRYRPPGALRATCGSL